MAKIDTLFFRKMAGKPNPLWPCFGAAHTYVAHIREYPPGPYQDAGATLPKEKAHLTVAPQPQTHQPH